MLVNNKPSYTIQSGGTYSPDTPIDINPESISNSESSYRFVEPIGGGGSEITDYVSKTNGGVFDNLISYPSALGIVDDFNIVYKKWVVDEIDTKIAAIGAGTVSSIIAGNGMNFSEITTTGTVTLGTPSTLTMATANALTSNSHTHALSGVQGYLDGTGFVKSTAGVISYDTNTYVATTTFNGLFDARFTTNFAASSLASLATRNHSNLNAIAGSSDGYHLSAGNYAIASRAATTAQSGYLTAADWNIFNSKLDALVDDGATINIAGGIISALPGGIDHNSLLNYNIANHRTINDAGVANTDLWSASKIISYLTDANITFTDVTTNNASNTKHGFLPKLVNDTSKYLRSDGAWITIPVNGDFLDSVIRMVVDNGFDPGATPADGDRYIIMNSGSIHANFGTIDKKLNGDALALGSNDLVQYVSSAAEFRIAYDSSTSTSPVTVTVGTDKNGETGHQWSYNTTDDVWVDRGSIGATHNSFSDLNTGVGDFYHVSSTEQTFIKAITSSATELNYLDGTTATANRIIRGDGTKLTSDANHTFDGTTLYVNGDINIASGKKYKINNVDLTYSDVGAQGLNSSLTSLAGLSYVSSSFVKMTGANTFALDTNTYSLSSHTHAESAITFTDITTNNVSTTKHGYTPKLPNDVNKYLNGLGNWATISSTSPGGSDTYVQFNDGGSFGGDSGLVFNKTTNDLTCLGLIAASNIRTNTTSLSTRVGYEAGLNEDEAAVRYNTLLGYSAGKTLTTGIANTLVGYLAGTNANNTSSGANTCVGFQSGTSMQNVTKNTYLGAYTGNNATGSSNVYIGYWAGYYETGSNKLFIDNVDRTDEATSRISSLIYGVFNSTPSSQELYLNSKLFVSNLSNASTSSGVFYNPSTKELSYSTVTSGASKLTSFYTDASTSGTGITTLYSYTIPANTLSTDGDTITAEYTLTATTATGTYTITLGGNSHNSVSLDWSSSTPVTVRITIIRISSSAVRISITDSMANLVSHSDYYSWSGYTFSSTIDLILKATANSSTITARMGTITKL